MTTNRNDEALRAAVLAYRSEYETPVPDYALRAQYRKAMFDALDMLTPRPEPAEAMGGEDDAGTLWRIGNELRQKCKSGGVDCEICATQKAALDRAIAALSRPVAGGAGWTIRCGSEAGVVLVTAPDGGYVKTRNEPLYALAARTREDAEGEGNG